MNIKSVFSVLMGFYILLLSVGVNVNKHYCAGELEKIAFFTSHQESCCDADKNPDCCKSENIKISLKENFSLNNAHYSLNSSFSTLKFVFNPPLLLNVSSSLLSYIEIFISPPDLKINKTLHILFLSLLI